MGSELAPIDQSVTIAVLATVGEAGARHAAMHRDRSDSLDAERRSLLQDADDDAIDQSVELSRTWRSAVVHAATGDRKIVAVVSAAEHRLRQGLPAVMAAFDEERTAGYGTAEAMRNAVFEVAATTSLEREKVQYAILAEIQQLAEGVNPACLWEVHNEWRAAGHGSAAEAAARLIRACDWSHADNVQTEHDDDILDVAVAEAATVSDLDPAAAAAQAARLRLSFMEAHDCHDAGDGYRKLEDWVNQWLLPVFAPAAGPHGYRRYWCPSWWRHDEAVLRLMALWRLWEHARHQATGMVAFLRELDYQLDRMFSEAGPFHGCGVDGPTDLGWSSATSHVADAPPPVEPVPESWWLHSEPHESARE